MEELTMKLPIDIWTEELETAFFDMDDKRILVKLNATDKEFFRLCMKHSKSKFSYNEDLETARQLISEKYGVEFRAETSVFSDDFWDEVYRQLDEGVVVDCQLRYVEDGEEFKFRSLNSEIVLRTTETPDGPYESIIYNGVEYMPDAAVDDDLCWWTFWTGVPRLERAFLVVGIRKLMCEHPRYCSTFYDTESGRIVFQDGDGYFSE